MLMKSKIKMSIAALVATSALLSGAVYAHGNDDNHGNSGQGYHSQHMKGHKMGRHMFRGLDLTEQQRTEIKALYKAQREQFKQQRQQMSQSRYTRRTEMLNVISADSFDATQAKQLIEQRQSMHQQQMLAQLELQNKVYHILTPEQQQKFKQRFEKAHKRHQSH